MTGGWDFVVGILLGAVFIAAMWFSIELDKKRNREYKQEREECFEKFAKILIEGLKKP